MASIRELAEGDMPALGGWCSIPSAVSAEVLAISGFDWIAIDLQHGPIGFETSLSMMRAVELARLPVLARVGSQSPDAIGRVLDAGAHGVIVPLVGTAQEARNSVEACRYPPMGHRSYGPTMAGMQKPYIPGEADADVFINVMIETRQGLDNLNSIAEVDGLDGLFVGPADLGLSLGRGIEGINDGSLDAELSQIAEVAGRNGLLSGIACPDTAMAIRSAELGFRLLAVSSDLALLKSAAASIVAKCRFAFSEPT